MPKTHYFGNNPKNHTFLDFLGQNSFLR